MYVFFQAEDGIRDRSPSRGLGDVYKRQVEQNAKKGLEFADIGYVLVSGETAIAGKGDDLLDNPDVGRLFLGG